ncbi:MAG TPA: UPF0280 family protein [bacterium]|nr:UPF0280 family protein [bacterium]
MPDTEKAYRFFSSGDLIRFRVREEESDLFIMSLKNLKKKSGRILHRLRKELKKYIAKNPAFHTSLMPLPDDPSAPPVIRKMIEASRKARCGPMAGVAGAVAEFLGRELMEESPEIIVENGGDIFLASGRERIIGLRSRALSPFGIRIKPGDTPLGVCSSSSRLGHSVSFGKAELVTVISPDTALADCYATSIANRIHSQEDLMRVIDEWRNKPGLTGILAVQESKVAFAGKIDFVSLTSD